MQPWHAEHPVDAALAEALVHAQFPEFRAFHAERVGTGWDTDVWRFDRVAFRFPRRALGVQTVRNEQRVLPGLAPLLPVPIPVPEWMGHASSNFPYSFYGHRHLDGCTADRAQLSAAARAKMAPSLAALLRRLHSIDAAQALRMGAQSDPGRADVARRLPDVRRILRDMQDELPKGLQTNAQSVLQEPLSQISQAPCLIHGDLYARHLLVNRRGELAGVIDWGDVCCGDPSADLSLVYSWLPAAARAAFFSVYGRIDAQTDRRARAIAVCYGARLLAYADDIADADLLECALIALRAAAA